MSQTPHRPGSDAPGSSEADPIPSGAVVAAPRRRVPVAVAALLALAIGISAVLLSGTDAPRGDVALAMELEEGQTYRYRMTMSMDMAIEPFSEKPFRSETSRVLAWRVLSRDPDGTMTVELRSEDITATVDGRTVSVPAPPREMRMRIAEDGRLLDAGGLENLFSAGSHQPIPGMNQFLPVLPQRPVGPGDSWERDFSAPMPFTDDPAVLHLRNRFIDYEEMGGVQAAVIETAITMPAMDFTVDAEDAANLEQVTGSPGAADVVPQGFEVTYRVAPMSFQQTSWVDPNAGELVRSEVEGSIDMRASFEGLPAAADLGEFGRMRFAGDLSMTMERL